MRTSFLSILLLLSLFLPRAQADESVSPEFQRRWLNVLGCWHNTEKNQYWCNAPVNGPNIRQLLQLFPWVEGKITRGESHEELCYALGEWNQLRRALTFLVGDLVESAPGISWELKTTLQNITWQLGGDNNYVYWDPLFSYCIQGREEYQNREQLLANWRRLSKEVYFGKGELDPYGVNAAFRRANSLLGIDAPFDVGTEL